MLKIREIVKKNKKPRRVVLNNNLVRYNESCVEPVCYPETFEGLIASFVDRYPFSKQLYKQVMTVWKECAEDFKV